MQLMTFLTVNDPQFITNKNIKTSNGYRMQRTFNY